MPLVVREQPDRLEPLRPLLLRLTGTTPGEVEHHVAGVGGLDQRAVASLQYDAGAWTPLAYDLGMCLTGTIVPVELQSFTAE